MVDVTELPTVALAFLPAQFSQREVEPYHTIVVVYPCSLIHDCLMWSFFLISFNRWQNTSAVIDAQY